MNSKKRAKYACLFLSPFIIIFLVFSVYPIFYSLVLSFGDMDALTGNFKFVGLENYKRLFTSEFFYKSFLNTFVIWIMSIVPQLTIAFVLSLMLNNKWLKGRFLLRNLYYFPNLVTPVTIGLLFGSMFSYPGGTVNLLLNTLGLTAVDFEHSPFLAQVVVSIAICWKNFGYNIIYFTAGLNSIPEDVFEAAEVDGANAWHRTTKIVIPMMRPMLIYVMITSIIGGLQIFDEAKMVFKSLAEGNSSLTTMVKYLYDSAFVRFQFGYGAACAFGIFIVISVFSVISLLATREKKEGR